MALLHPGGRGLPNLTKWEAGKRGFLRILGICGGGADLPPHRLIRVKQYFFKQNLIETKKFKGEKL